MTFKEYVRLKRIQLKLTQQDCADRMCIDRSNYSRLESGTTEWTFKKMELFVSAILGKTLLDAFTEMDEYK